jgi:hypothetical protein
MSREGVWVSSIRVDVLNISWGEIPPLNKNLNIFIKIYYK